MLSHNNIIPLIVTYSIFRPIELSSEFITVTEEEFPAPDINDCSNSEVTVLVVLSLNCTSLQSEWCKYYDRVSGRV